MISAYQTSRLYELGIELILFAIGIDARISDLQELHMGIELMSAAARIDVRISDFQTLGV